MEGNPQQQQQVKPEQALGFVPPPNPVGFPGPYPNPPAFLPSGHQQPLLPMPRYDEEYMDHLKQLNEKLLSIREEIEKMPKSIKAFYQIILKGDVDQFKDQKLPLARIKKIMKSDEDVRMISAEAPILFAKACEMFIVEMTHKAYYYAKKNNRKTLQRNDIAAAITDTEIYDFLLDIMPRDEMIGNAKDKQLSSYQLQLLDDINRMQQLQAPPIGLQQQMYEQQKEEVKQGGDKIKKVNKE